MYKENFKSCICPKFGLHVSIDYIYKFNALTDRYELYKSACSASNGLCGSSCPLLTKEKEVYDLFRQTVFI